jgi:hypothetical protein
MNPRSFVSVIVLFGVFTTSIAQEGLLPTAAPAVRSVQPLVAVVPIAEAAVPKKEPAEGREQELLRDPFWPVGFFPQDWQQKSSAQSATDMAGSGWKAAFAKLKVSGTSRLGDRTAAIVNGELKNIGEQVEVLYEGRIYQWEIVGIDATGQIQVKRLGNR